MATNYANPSSWTQAYNRTAPTNGDRSGFQYTQRPTYTPYAYNVPTPQSYTPWAVPGTVNFTGGGDEQAQQNANQWGAEFGAAQNQWGQQFGWQQQSDQFNMGLTAQQQAMAEWQAQQQQANWLDQFNYQQGRDQWEQGFAGQQLDQAREAARWNTFGRNQTPNFKWMRGW